MCGEVSKIANGIDVFAQGERQCLGCISFVQNGVDLLDEVSAFITLSREYRLKATTRQRCRSFRTDRQNFIRFRVVRSNCRGHVCFCRWTATTAWINLAYEVARVVRCRLYDEHHR